MQCFSSNPLNVLTQAINSHTTYDDIAAWLESGDATAIALRQSITNERCVAFIQIGGSDRVLCCAPHPVSPAKYAWRVCPLKRARGVLGKATMMLYK